MGNLIVIVVLVVVVVAVLAVVIGGKARASGEGPWPYYAKRPLSAPEQVLYFRLRNALPDHIVLAQVALSRILGVKKGHNFNAWFNRIARMSADFVVCTRDAAVVAVIELDDASHDRATRQAADTKKERALDAAGLRILRWQAKAIPDEAAIRRALVPAPPGAEPAQDAGQR